jgi:hypothetical protein
VNEPSMGDMLAMMGRIEERLSALERNTAVRKDE